MGRAATIDRLLRDAVELRELLDGSTASPQRTRLEHLARRRAEDVGPSVPKATSARLLGVSVTALDRWIARGAIPVVRRPSSNRQELETKALIELAIDVRALRESGRTRAVLATALSRLSGARETRPAPMGTRGFFPDHRHERREELTALTPGERVAQAIGLSRSATRIAAAAARARARTT